jgi:hypothetical protein
MRHSAVPRIPREGRVIQTQHHRLRVAFWLEDPEDPVRRGFIAWEGPRGGKNYLLVHNAEFMLERALKDIRSGKKHPIGDHLSKKEVESLEHLVKELREEIVE